MKALLQPMLAALLLCSALAGGPTAAQTEPVVRFSAPAVESWMEAYYAQQTGAFEKAGLNVDLDIPLSAANILTAVATGQADFGIAATTAIAMAVVNGLPLVVVAPAAVSTPRSQVDRLCVAKSSSIETAKDLEGKTVGVIGLRQFGDLSLRAWLKKNGADVSRVRIIQAPFAAMGAALDRGTYDAAVMTEPTLTYALKNDAIRCIAYPDLAIATEFTIGAWVVNKSFLEKNPAIVQRVTTVLEDTARWANSHRAETAVLVNKLTKIDLSVIASEQMRPLYGDRIVPAQLQAPLDAAYTFGFLPKHVTADDLLGK